MPSQIDRVVRKYSIAAALTVASGIRYGMMAEALRFAIVALRPARTVAVENLFLRRQLAMYVERGLKPSRPDVATRVSLVLLSRLFDWRSALVVVRPENA